MWLNLTQTNYNPLLYTQCKWETFQACVHSVRVCECCRTCWDVISVSFSGCKLNICFCARYQRFTLCFTRVVVVFRTFTAFWGAFAQCRNMLCSLSLTHTCECTRALSPNHPIRTETNQKPIITQFIYENSAMDKRWGCFSKRKPTFKWVSPSDSEVICTETLR